MGLDDTLQERDVLHWVCWEKHASSYLKMAMHEFSTSSFFTTMWNSMRIYMSYGLQILWHDWSQSLQNLTPQEIFGKCIIINIYTLVIRSVVIWCSIFAKSAGVFPYYNIYIISINIYNIHNNYSIINLSS